MSTYTIRPISDRTAFTGDQYGDPFRASWPDTEHLLMDEVDRLDGKNVVLELDVREKDIRLDGRLRADARPTSPGVRLAFESRVGALTYATDRYRSWLANARAIALGLQALRAVDRYGITQRGEQYTGFKALPSGTPMSAGEPRMTESTAAELLRGYAEAGATLAKAYKAAVKATHPDLGGNREAFDRVQAAAQVMGLAK